jgi:hypothetical protein
MLAIDDVEQALVSRSQRSALNVSLHILGIRQYYFSKIYLIDYQSEYSTPPLLQPGIIPIFSNETL